MEPFFRGRVLLGEDDADQVDVLRELLEAEGYEVLLAHNSLQLVQKLTQHPDVVLMDLHGVSSPAVFAALEAFVRRPVLVLVSGDSRLPELARRYRADAYLDKPYELGDLLEVVGLACSGRQMARLALESASA